MGCDLLSTEEITETREREVVVWNMDSFRELSRRGETITRLSEQDMVVQLDFRTERTFVVLENGVEKATYKYIISGDPADDTQKIEIDLFNGRATELFVELNNGLLRFEGEDQMSIIGSTNDSGRDFFFTKVE